MTEDEPEPEDLPDLVEADSESLDELVAGAIAELLLSEGRIPSWFYKVYENL